METTQTGNSDTMIAIGIGGESHWKVMYWGYVSLFIPASIIMLITIIWWVFNLRREFCNKFLDIYRITQFIILIWYLLALLVTNSLRFLEKFEIYNLATFIYVSFGYYLSEVLHVFCWVTFVFHLRFHTQEGIRSSFEIRQILKLKWKEKIILVIICLIIVWYLVQWVYLNIFTIISDWSNCHPFYGIDAWSKNCKKVAEEYFTIFRINTLIGVGMITIKACFGVYLLKLMRTNLNFFYLAQRYQI